MPFNQVFQSLGAIASIIVPTKPSVRPLEIDLELPEPLTKAELAVLGRWVSEDGAIRLDLRPNGRFGKQRDQAPGHGGRYEVDASQLYFESDAGHVWSGELRRGQLAFGEKRFRRILQLAPARLMQSGR
ncbi:Atu4866 domain-containing protein [Bosea sp. CCNWLW174]|uniref:Atu4866 domain-containing protein n=1 Tax=unclassified Bosea (in: a-proteobacteria) TaxID=2653178 RepID=UPI0030144705